VPSDASEWLYSFIGAAETYPACIVISDMAIAGNPMFYVNQEFCRTTGYAKKEAMGRNCRFLQGPRTEPASVAVIQDTLRRGVDCHVRLTNYRKNGETFQNLLSMRPVHDSNGVYRFCIGVQFEVAQNAQLKERLKKLDVLLQLLPDEIHVQSRRGAGRTHIKDKVAACHSWEARSGAANKMRANFARVFQDITNPSTTDNIEGKPLTQTELKRVSAPEDRAHAEAGLNEIIRRLVGDKQVYPSSPDQNRVWIAVATYLDGRIQGSPYDKPGREPDMSEAEAAAVRGVLELMKNEKSTSDAVAEALQFTERVAGTDISTSARYAENRDVMLEAIDEDAD